MDLSTQRNILRLNFCIQLYLSAHYLKRVSYVKCKMVFCCEENRSIAHMFIFIYIIILMSVCLSVMFIFISISRLVFQYMYIIVNYMLRWLHVLSDILFPFIPTDCLILKNSSSVFHLQDHTRHLSSIGIFNKCIVTLIKKYKLCLW